MQEDWSGNANLDLRRKYNSINIFLQSTAPVAVGMYMRVYQYDDAINSVGSIVDLGVPYTGESEMP
ncbi:hypothetical protein N7489_007789 [Penicillium chrysogenum]|nr:uncharacterized protein N7525_001893 [Penicillium rubens]XP_056567254.1 uncharacterized protein N7489_007789 [Penicillium chrysogenum]KAJ5237698.1 hypothetical protein N7489_007789 [Penicillium chrysogenum]KAJ5262037.1 hypothetical protein N7505_008904 [Penicillium chrysogenum]KAJ5277999.1 hypothetical protein N7524_004152 [Penicillium chrysogenum]KAJ5844152.1 hypothetical protein N7525_001893 [Penicillium rubens]KAJ5845262.1 hypothetical protein N7534_008931 [Penicillium rubens]